MPLESRADLPALTGLRFLAAFSILFAHASDWLIQFPDAGDVKRYLTFVSIYGMPLFFVLSGFVIHYNYASLFRTRRLVAAVAEFSIARFARIVPLYLFFLFFSIATDSFVIKASTNPGLAEYVLLRDLTATQTWWFWVSNGYNVVWWLCPIAWSISTEIFFYVAYPPLVFAIVSLSRIRVTMTVALVFSVVVLGGLLYVRIYWFDAIRIFGREHFEAGMLATDSFNSFTHWLFYVSPYVRIFEFILGCLTAQLFMLMDGVPISARERMFGKLALWLSSASLIAFGAIYLRLLPFPAVNGYGGFLAENFLCAPSMAVMIFCLARYEGAFANALASPPLVALGTISYSIYLAHTWALRPFIRDPQSLTLASGIDAVERIVVGIGFSLLVAFATFTLVEMPCRKWLRAIAGTKRPLQSSLQS